MMRRGEEKIFFTLLLVASEELSVRRAIAAPTSGKINAGQTAAISCWRTSVKNERLTE